jgi:ribosomal-protein-alanine N-acetyltransferase
MDQMARIHAASFTVPRPWAAAEFADLMSMRGVFCEATSQGFVVGRLIAGEAELLTLAVDPAARRRGMGRALLAKFLSHLGESDRAFLEVAAGNAPARALYRASGWAESGLRRGYYRHPDRQSEDAVIMTWAFSRT